MVTLNRIVAVAMVHGPEAGLQHLAAAKADPRSPATTDSTPSAHTCSTWQVTSRRHVPTTASPPAVHPDADAAARMKA